MYALGHADQEKGGRQSYYHLCHDEILGFGHILAKLLLWASFPSHMAFQPQTTDSPGNYYNISHLKFEPRETFKHQTRACSLISKPEL